MSATDVIVIGASAGGLDAVIELANNLNAELAAAIFVVIHMSSNRYSAIPNILARRSKMRVIEAQNNLKFENGVIYTAQPNKHLTIDNQKMMLTYGPKVNRVRPSIDVLFESAAQSFGKKTTGVVLSGALNDGTAGLIAIKRHGGFSIVQDPQEALFKGMPSSAIAFDHVDKILPVREIANELNQIGKVSEAHEERENMSEQAEKPVPAESHSMASMEPPSKLTCPECGGAIWEIADESFTKFVCHQGHSYTPELMLEEQAESLEKITWILLRTLKENAELHRQMAMIFEKRKGEDAHDYHLSMAEKAEKQQKHLEKLLISDEKGNLNS